MKEQIKKQWRRVRAKLPHLTRKGKIIRNLVCLVLLAGLCYLLLGAPPLTAGQAFRRAERQNLFGPSERLAVFEPSAYPMEVPELILGEMDNGPRYLAKKWNESRYVVVGEMGGYLSYLYDDGVVKEWFATDKVEPITLYEFFSVVSSDSGYCGGLSLLYAKLPQVRYARIELTAYQDVGDTVYMSKCAGEAEGDENGLFLLQVPRVQDPVVLENSGGEHPPNTAHVILMDENREVVYDGTWIQEGRLFYEG